jgi:hypothetical protein
MTSCHRVPSSDRCDRQRPRPWHFINIHHDQHHNQRCNTTQISLLFSMSPIFLLPAILSSFISGGMTLFVLIAYANGLLQNDFCNILLAFIAPISGSLTVQPTLHTLSDCLLPQILQGNVVGASFAYLASFLIFNLQP